ncbi:MAG: hypothetical protein JEZ00_06215 [Anaerolineaceae bacterium]|nr:hypothetical protein [Anaerolineaceae bacterium]
MLKLLRISGNSIAPYLHDGDFAIIRKQHRKLSLNPGDYVVFKEKSYGRLIKQIESIDSQHQKIFVRGSDDFSTDSRLFGAITPEQIIGKVIFRIKA